MTSNALAILLSLNALASTSLAQSPADDPNYRGNDPEGAVTTSKLQIHVSNTRVSKIDYCNNCWNIFCGTMTLLSLLPTYVFMYSISYTQLVLLLILPCFDFELME